MGEDANIRNLGFTSTALDGDPLRLCGIAGRESLSELYEYRLILEHDPGALADGQLDELLLAPCSFSLGDGEYETIHGIVREIELVEAVPTRPARYLATVVPSIWLMTLSKISRVFQEKSVVEMATDLLKRYGLRDGHEYEFQVSESGGAAGGPGHRREFAIQYDESDWDFIQRWLEHDGLHYWFEHLPDGEKLVIGDGQTKPKTIPDPSTMSYHEWGGDRPPDTVSNWRLSQRRIPARVALKEYNYRKPALPLVCQEVVDAKRGFGTVFSYGEHFRDEEAGKALAARRAAELRCQRLRFLGKTTCTRFRVGQSFGLENHFDDRYEGKSYLITSLEVHVGATMDDPKPQPFIAGFEAMPAEIPFRPERKTPWPHISGVVYAHIDSDVPGEYASIDEVGRYRVRLPFDTTGTQGDKVSQWIRMAQPYAGAGYGTHFPLHKGAEVLLAFLDGDPDRPVILGAVPNALTPSPSTRQNATQSVIATASGIRIEMEDKK